MTARLVLLPGLGTIGRLFDPQRNAFPHLEVPSWLDPHPGESLPPHLAARLAAYRRERPNVDVIAMRRPQ